MGKLPNRAIVQNDCIDGISFVAILCHQPNNAIPFGGDYIYAILWLVYLHMSKIYSKDFRECVVQNILDGMPQKEA
jgi:hypothetical protein